MTHLRKLTLDEIARRNYTEGTTRTYLRIIEDLARYFHRLGNPGQDERDSGMIPNGVPG